MKETDLQSAIMLAVSADGHYVERIQSGQFLTKYGGIVRIGFVGRSDLSGFRKGDAKAFFFEVKTATGRATVQQLQFITAMKNRGAIAGIVRSVDDAFALLTGKY